MRAPTTLPPVAHLHRQSCVQLCAHLAANTEILSLNLAGNCLDDESE